MVFTPVYRLEDRTIKAIMSLEWDGPLTFVLQRDNPHNDEDVRQRGVKNHLHQYQRGRDTFLRGDYDALLVIEDDIIPPSDTLIRLAGIMNEHPECGIAFGTYLFRHSSNVLNILNRYKPWPQMTRNTGETLTIKTVELKKARRRGVTDCSGSGLGCTLIRRDVVKAVPFENYTDNGSHFDFPWNDEVYRRGYRMMADMNVKCGHIEDDGGVLWPS